MGITQTVDTILDRTVALGYTKVGYEMRRHWWPADPKPGSMAGKRVLVTGATSGIGEAASRLVNLSSPNTIGATVNTVRSRKKGW